MKFNHLLLPVQYRVRAEGNAQFFIFFHADGRFHKIRLLVESSHVWTGTGSSTSRVEFPIYLFRENEMYVLR